MICRDETVDSAPVYCSRWDMQMNRPSADGGSKLDRLAGVMDCSCYQPAISIWVRPAMPGARHMFFVAGRQIEACDCLPQKWRGLPGTFAYKGIP